MSALDIEVRDIRFKISSRLWNCLMAENMDTLGDVVELAGYEWLRVPGFGRLALKELEDFLATQGLQLKSGPTPFKVRAADKIKKLRQALLEVARVNNRRDRFSPEIDRIILDALAQDESDDAA
jgi:hypothetical protein